MNRFALALAGLGSIALSGCSTPPDAPATPPTAESVRLGLDWLARHQDPDGRFDADRFMKHDRAGEPCDGAGNPTHDIGVTGLALLAFLGGGNTMRSGPYQDVVKKAVKWLRAQQGANGLFGTAVSHDFIYDHAIAAWAICEAYGLSNYKTLRKTAQAGINYLESHRNPFACWRYQPRDQDNDSSVTSWCLMAYRSARDFGLEVNPNALRLAARFLDELTNPATGQCGYTKRGERSSRHPGDHATRFPVERGESLTAAALLSRFLLGQSPGDFPVMGTAADTILTRPPKWSAAGDVNHLYWYFGTFALYQIGGQHWRDWRTALDAAVLPRQRRDGNFEGSWDPVGVWGEDGGRIYSTALLVLTLEAYSRDTRLVR